MPHLRACLRRQRRFLIWVAILGLILALEPALRLLVCR